MVGVTGDYAYIYNTAAQTVAVNSSATFSANGPLSGTVNHTGGANDIVIGRTGVYLIKYNVNGEIAESQFTMYRNGTPIAGTTYDDANGNVYGQFIVTAQVGDVLTLVNTGKDPVTLGAEGTGDTAVVNTSVTVVRIF